MTCAIILPSTTILLSSFFFFFFNDTATTEIYTLSLHDALPIYQMDAAVKAFMAKAYQTPELTGMFTSWQVNVPQRSEEHTSELQSQSNLVCRLLLEKKKKITLTYMITMMISKNYSMTRHLASV